LREKADKAFSKQPRFDEKELEIQRLKARVSELEEEREILKKTPVFSQRRKVGDLRDDKAVIGFPWWREIMSGLRFVTEQLLAVAELSDC